MAVLLIIGFVGMGATAVARSTTGAVVAVLLSYVLGTSWALQRLGLSEAAASDIALISVFAVIFGFIFWGILFGIFYSMAKARNGGDAYRINTDRIMGKTGLLTLIPVFFCILYWVSLPGGA